MTRAGASGLPQPPAGGGRPADVRSIAVIRALALGDMLCAVPSFRGLRARYPEARISLIGLPWASALVDRYPAYLDEHIVFTGYPGIPEVVVDPRRVVASLAELQRRRFDLVVQLHGNGLAINDYAQLVGGRDVAGFYPPGLIPPEPGTWVPYPSHGSEVERLLSLAAALGAPTDPALEFPVDDNDRAELARLMPSDLASSPRIAVIHAGGSTPGRRWPADRFAAVADGLAGRGLDIVLSGTAAEGHVTESVARSMRAAATDLAGRTSLGAAAALIERARLVVTNDTGISHLAAAVGTPSVIVFTASDRDRWAPLEGDRHIGVGAWAGGPGCRHDSDGVHRCVGDACSLEERRQGVTPGSDVAVDDVLAAVAGLLARIDTGGMVGGRRGP